MVFETILTDEFMIVENIKIMYKAWFEAVMRNKWISEREPYKRWLERKLYEAQSESQESDSLPCGSSRFMIFKVPEFYPCGGISDCVGRYETLESAKEAFKEKGYYEDCYIYDRFKDKVVYNPEADE